MTASTAPGASETVASTPPLGLREQTALGALWVGLQLGAIKLGTLATQLALAYLLVPREIGAYGIALGITGVIGVSQSFGLRENVVRRMAADGAHGWLRPALALAGGLGLASGMAAALAGTLLVAAGHETTGACVLVLAIAQPFTALAAVLSGAGQARMQFQRLAFAATVAAIVRLALSVGLAGGGAGAMGLAVAFVTAEAVQLALLPWRPRGDAQQLHSRPVRELLRDGRPFLVIALTTAAAAYGDYLVLALFEPVEAVGYYVWAYALSTQLFQLLTTLAAAALLPPFVRALAEPGRDPGRALIESSRALGLVFLPAFVFQSLIAAAGIELVFGERWSPAAQPAAALSLAMAAGAPAMACPVFLTAAGRFRALAQLAVAVAVALVAGVTVAAAIGDVTAAAWTVFAVYAVQSPIYFVIAARPHGATTRDLAATFGLPLFVAAASSVPAMIALGVSGAGLAALLVALTMPFLYVALLRTFDPAGWRTASGAIAAAWRARTIAPAPLQPGPAQ